MAGEGEKDPISSPPPLPTNRIAPRIRPRLVLVLLLMLPLPCHGCFTEFAWAIRLVIVWVRPRQGPETTMPDAGSDQLSVRARLVSLFGPGMAPSGILHHPQPQNVQQRTPT